ncbi:MAG: hypothetical protein L0191_01870 [Acidobacteria bacterium]|nr:hypothetical protein [Acidobacteriota bacterium]
MLPIYLSPADARTLRALLSTIDSAPGTDVRFAVEETLDAIDAAIGPDSAPPPVLWRVEFLEGFVGRVHATAPVPHPV